MYNFSIFHFLCHCPFRRLLCRPSLSVSIYLAFLFPFFQPFLLSFTWSSVLIQVLNYFFFLHFLSSSCLFSFCLFPLLLLFLFTFPLLLFLLLILFLFLLLFLSFLHLSSHPSLPHFHRSFYFPIYLDRSSSLSHLLIPISLFPFSLLHSFLVILPFIPFIVHAT